MQAIKLICPPHNRFRLGMRGLATTSEWLHSDTLFSGIINTHALLFGESETTGLIDRFRERKIRLSSAFPLVELSSVGSSVVHLFFLPRPFCHNKPQQSERAEPGVKKKIKQLKYLSLQVFEAMLQTATKEQDEITFAFDLLELPKLGEGFVISKEEQDRLLQIGCSNPEHIIPISTHETAKVNLQQVENAGPFYETDLYLNRGMISKQKVVWQTHFYFLLEHELQEEELKQFFAALNLLGDEGIGGERSTGAGCFDGFEFLQFQWRLDGPYQTNLALVSPRPDELSQIVSYEAIIRGGSFLSGDNSNTKRKQSLRMIREGSIFREKMSGALVEIGQLDQRPVYRNGINFGLSFGEQT